MNTQKMQVAGLVLAMGLSGTAHAALQGRDLNGSAGSFEAYYDTVLDITWLADANYAQTSGHDADGRMTWATANTWAANLSFYNPLTNQTYADWRLPTISPVNGTSINFNYSTNGSTDRGFNVSEQGTVFAGATGSEMAHLFYNTLNNKSSCDPVTSTGSSCVSQIGWGLNNTGPFANLLAYYYWSATQYAGPETTSTVGLYFSFNDGYQSGINLNAEWRSLAVSPGDVGVAAGVAAVPEPETYAMLLAGLGLVGWAARRKVNKV